MTEPVAKQPAAGSRSDRFRRYLLRLRHNNPVYVNRRGNRPAGRLPLPPRPSALLEELERLPVSTWRYNWEDPDVRHLGPMAQDFAAAFGLGENERWIDTTDADGVSMVAVQELTRRLRRLEARIEQLEGERAQPPKPEAS